MDASSGVAVLALDVQQHHNVLDLCAAPGAKLCFIHDIMTGLAAVRSDRSAQPDAHPEVALLDDLTRNSLRKTSDAALEGGPVGPLAHEVGKHMNKSADNDQSVEPPHTSTTTTTSTTTAPSPPNPLPRAPPISGTVTGVDINKDRLPICRSIAKKYSVGNARLFLADGTSFDVSAPVSGGRWWERTGSEGDPTNGVGTGSAHATEADAVDSETATDGGTAVIEGTGAEPTLSTDVATTTLFTPSPSLPSPRSPLQRLKPFHAPRHLRFLTTPTTPNLYDRVLVDAECTHDGSSGHLLKFGPDWEGFEKRFFVARGGTGDGVAGLPKLQMALLENGA
ncbi:hypothetical protein HDU93_006828 [Gonapodya sp. JEL0774]|nr:hypothetical protein HDU93_006828 [Gonapodya sp. JEL0774]